MNILSNEYKKRHYCRKANKGYWFDFAQDKLDNKYFKKFGEDFNLVIYNDSKKIEYYAIPFKDIKHLLTPNNLKKDGKWMGTIKNDLLTIKDKYSTMNVKKYFFIHSDFIDSIIYPDELLSEDLSNHDKTHTEGAKMSVVVNKYERNPNARVDCIDYWGTKCKVCDLDFESKYGSIGKGFIHVHHLVPISQIKSSYELNPIKDLIPVCPNCHAMIHKRNPPFSIDELQKILKV